MKPATPRRVALTSLVMLAFAANSLLCREALASGAIGVADFTVVRLGSGALTLWLWVAITRGRSGVGGDWGSAFALLGYAACFSLGYTTLSAGTGALLLFGAVQISMISWGLIRGERLWPAQWLGLVAAFAGLAWVLSPGVEAPPLAGAALMVASGACWGVYSLRGRSAKAPVVATAGNFVRAAPFALVLYLFPHQTPGSADPTGWLLAVASGAVASGLAYALWYAVLRTLAATTAATVQLSVPIIAAIGGVVWLAEPLTARLAVAATIVLGGILLFIQSGRRAA